MPEADSQIATLREQYTGIDKRSALPVPAEYLEDLDARLEMGLRIEVPESVIREGFQIRHLIHDMAREAEERYEDEPSMGASRINAIERHSEQLLADFYVRQKLITDDVMIVFVSGDKIQPVPDDGEGTAGVPAVVKE